MSAGAWSLPDWPRHLGAPEVRARLRAEPEDFQVWELPLIEPEGDGPHLWLEVRKRGANTRWVAEQLARAAGAKPRDVGYAGMKDRHAVTTQWFSIGLQEAGNADWQSWQVPDVTILQAVRHRRKLQTGALRGNRFRILVRDLEGSLEGLEARCRRLAGAGFPNYFGEQRFGRDGGNLVRGARWLEQGGRISRGERSIYLSALRSYLFNTVLAERVRRDNWNRLLDGDVAMLDGSRSTFPCRLPDPVLERRCAEFDIHPTGPLPGRGGGGAEREAQALEREALREQQGLVESLDKAGVTADRRSLRVLPAELRWRLGEDGLTLDFSLPPGAYATSLLRELVMTGPGTISGEA
jgi:tRNA pseudouridine13 synthase